MAGIKALACEPPEQRAVPLSRWSSAELAAEAAAEGLVPVISSSTGRYNHTATPFDWRFSTNDLANMCHRVDATANHEEILPAA